MMPEEQLTVWYYFELRDLLNKIANSGILSAYSNLRKAMETAGIKISENYNPEVMLFHVHYPVGIMTNIYRAMYKGKLPIIVHAHSTAEDLANSFVFTNEIKPFAKSFFKKLYSDADVVLCPTPYAKALLETYDVDTKIIPISNGVNTEHFRHDEQKRKEFRARNNLKEEDIVVYSVGHVIERKGCYDFAQVAENLPNYKFFWYGKIYNALLANSLRLMPYIEGKLPNLKFFGYVKDIIEVSSGSDIFLFPSKEELQGIAILEAAAMGKPIIVRDLPVYRDWLCHGVNCLKAETTEDFIYYVQVLAEDREYAKKLGQNALKVAEQNSVFNVGTKLKQIYLEVIEDFKK